MPTSSRRAVLLADDDRDSADRVANGLPDTHLVSYARSVNEALQILASCRIDVAVIDVMLPITRLTLSSDDTAENYASRFGTIVETSAGGPGLDLYRHIADEHQNIRCVIYSKISPLVVRNWRSDIEIACPILQKPPTGKIEALLAVILRGA